MRGQFEIQWPKGDIVEDGGVEQLVVAVLKDDADLAGKVAALTGIARVQPADAQRAASRLKYPAEAQEQAGFARAVRTDEANALAGGHVKRNTGQSGRAAGIRERQIARLDGDLKRHLSSPMRRRYIPRGGQDHPTTLEILCRGCPKYSIHGVNSKYRSQTSNAAALAATSTKTSTSTGRVENFFSERNCPLNPRQRMA